ncbi:hypothetical protein ACWD4N_48270, partial [Streptomyces sp. NPDC002586]
VLFLSMGQLGSWRCLQSIASVQEGGGVDGAVDQMQCDVHKVVVRSALVSDCLTSLGEQNDRLVPPCCPVVPVIGSVRGRAHP